MASPDLNIVETEPPKHSVIIREPSDDSGYVTVTPSSAECTWMSSDISGNSSMRIPHLSHNILSDSLHLHNIPSFSLSTPEECCVKKPREFKYRPKQLFNKSESFVEQLLSTGVSSENDSISREKDALPTHIEGEFDSVNNNNLKRPSLKRQKSAMDESEYSNVMNFNTEMTPKSETDSCVDKFGNLAFLEDKSNVFHSAESSSCFKSSLKRGANSDPREYNKYYVSLNHRISNDFDLNTPSVQPITKEIKQVCTPIKGHKKMRRSSPEESFLDRSSRTPERDDASPSADSHSSDHKFVKKLSFDLQKLGSPEKNKLLYPELKPVTPPKRMKTTKSESPKCRKRLQMKERQSYAGREHVDFLKLLGEEHYHGPAVCRILNYLSGDDLVNVCNVSECWNNVCRSVKNAEKRKCKTIQENEKVKENRIDWRSNIKVRKEKPIHSANFLTSREHLGEIQNHLNIAVSASKAKSPPVSPGKRNVLRYYKAGSEDSAIRLCKCPRCQGPAKVRNEWAICGGQTCGYIFCPRCRTDGALGSSCFVCLQRCLEAPSPSKQPQPRHGICSKKSRKNLRRL